MIGLVDCNSFFVSCQVVFNPKLKGKPVVVLSGNDGCIVSRSREAKALGIKMGEPVFKVKHLIRKHKVYTFSSNFSLYADMSQRVMTILLSAAPRVSIYSIDEAFLDLSNIPREDLKYFAIDLKEKIRKWTGIPVSVGIAPTKTLAKVAVHKAKVDLSLKGIKIIKTKSEIDKELISFKVSDVWGIGRESARFLKFYGIDTAYQFTEMPDVWVRKNLKIFGLKTLKELQGSSHISFEEKHAPKKQIIRSRSFKNPIIEIEPLGEALASFAARAAYKLREQGSYAYKIGIFIRSSNYLQSHLRYSKSYEKKFITPTNDTSLLISATFECLEKIFQKGIGYKKAGVVLNGIVSQYEKQLGIFKKDQKELCASLIKVVDQINNKMGSKTVRYAAEGINERLRYRSEKKSKLYTTNWEDLLRVS